jgi:proteic killer suppression protein
VIKTWSNRASQRFHAEGKSSPFRGLDVEGAQDLLAALDAAQSLQDLSPLKSIGLHKLKGDRAGQWAMTVNARWRICFRYKNGDAPDVEIIDYHRG